MLIKGVRLYGKNDLRLEEFELPALKENEILAKVICDSICMSTYKAVKQGPDHKRVPENISRNPVIIGHEFSGEIIEVGNKWEDKFHTGMKFSIQPAINYPYGPAGLLSAPGYSYKHIGGDATYIIIPNEVMENDCLLHYQGNGYFPAALAEPLSCVIGAMHANYHRSHGSYIHKMDIADGGNMAIVAGVGSMGLAAINYVIHRKDRKPKLLVVTDINAERLKRAEQLYSPEEAEKNGIQLKYVNTGSLSNPPQLVLEMSGGKGYDDVFIFAPVTDVVEFGDAILSYDGCLNFFAGPGDSKFKAAMNFYNVHYNNTHLVGTSGGNSDDMKEALDMIAKGLNPAGLATHIGGLDAVIHATCNLPDIPGGKKLIYNHISLELTDITEFEKKGKTNPLFKKLHEITKVNKGLWSIEAEEYLLKHANKI